MDRGQWSARVAHEFRAAGEGHALLVPPVQIDQGAGVLRSLLAFEIKQD